MINYVKTPLAVVIAALCFFCQGVLAQDSDPSKLQRAVDRTKEDLADLVEIWRDYVRTGNQNGLASVRLFEGTANRDTCEEILRILYKLKYRMKGNKKDPAYSRAEVVVAKFNFLHDNWHKSSGERNRLEIYQMLLFAYEELWPPPPPKKPKPKRIRTK